MRFSCLAFVGDQTSGIYALLHAPMIMVRHLIFSPLLPHVPPIYISFFAQCRGPVRKYCRKTLLFTLMHKPPQKLGNNSSEAGNSGLCFFFFFIISSFLHYFCSIESPLKPQQTSYAGPALQAQEGQMVMCFSGWRTASL